MILVLRAEARDEGLLERGAVRRLRGRIPPRKFRGRDVDERVLRRLPGSLKTLALREGVLPLRVRAPRCARRERRGFRFPSVVVADEGDHAVAAGDVAFELLEERVSLLLEVALDDDLGAHGAEVACQRVAARFEFTGDGREEDSHVAGRQSRCR